MSVYIKIQYLVITDSIGTNTLLVSREKSITKITYFYNSMNIQVQTLVLNDI